MAVVYQLTSEQSFHTFGKDARDALFVKSGVVQVSVRRIRKESVPAVCSLTECAKGMLLPCFSFVEADETQWEFILRPLQDEAVIEYRAGVATNQLRASFLRGCDLQLKPEESFEGCLMDWLYASEMKDARFVSGVEKQMRHDAAQGVRIIAGALNTRDMLNQAASSLEYNAMSFLCQRQKIKIAPENTVHSAYGNDATVADIAELSGFLCRPVSLKDDWYRNDCGCIVAQRAMGPIACYPVRSNRYMLYDPKTGATERVDAKNVASIDRNAYSIGRALPDTSLTKKDMIRFVRGSVRTRDIVFLLIIGLVGALIGLLLPTLNQQIYDDFIPLAAAGPMVQLGVVIASFMIGNLFISLVKKMLEFRVSSRVGYDMQDAMYHRVFRLPQSFFRSIDSADLAQRLSSFKTLTTQYVNALVVTGFSTLFSLIFLFRMISDSGKLTIVSSLMLLVYAALVFVLNRCTIGYGQRIAALDGDATSRLYQYISGVDKLRMAGAEDAALNQYLIPFVEMQRQEVKRSRISAVSPALGCVISSVFSMVLYYMIIHSKIELSTGSFIAFNTAFGTFSSSIITLTDVSASLFALKPMLERVRPLLQNKTEDCGASEQMLPGDLNGSVSVKDVTFGYERDKMILKGVNIDIAPGEYIGITGASGCGKSTLMKLLLGFEKPDTGCICYDHYELEHMNKRALRKKLGVVLQNDHLISGSIYDNITITSPGATHSDVQRVLEQVGLQDDINTMPMGVQTMVGEDGGVLSGGQVQRILIARAIIGSPKALLFDEATSALDNITQRMVCESLDRISITRIVIAHRLSTIERCDRIYYMKDGQVAEQGTFAELMAQRGEFCEMVQRQLVNEGGDEMDLLWNNDWMALGDRAWVYPDAKIASDTRALWLSGQATAEARADFASLLRQSLRDCAKLLLVCDELTYVSAACLREIVASQAEIAEPAHKQIIIINAQPAVLSACRNDAIDQQLPFEERSLPKPPPAPRPIAAQPKPAPRPMPDAAPDEPNTPQSGLVLFISNDEPWFGLSSQPKIAIGRLEDADIAIPNGHNSVSRQHAQITKTEHGYILCDVGSRYGTSLDGQPLAPHAEMPLRQAHQLTLANHYSYLMLLDPLFTVTPEEYASFWHKRHLLAALHSQNNGTLYVTDTPLPLGRSHAIGGFMQSKGIGREQGEITFENGNYYIIDRGSRNGTYLNGQEIAVGTPVMLTSGDKLRLGGEQYGETFTWEQKTWQGTNNTEG